MQPASTCHRTHGPAISAPLWSAAAALSPIAAWGSKPAGRDGAGDVHGAGGLLRRRAGTRPSRPRPAHRPQGRSLTGPGTLTQRRSPEVSDSGRGTAEPPERAVATRSRPPAAPAARGEAPGAGGIRTRTRRSPVMAGYCSAPSVAAWVSRQLATASYPADRRERAASPRRRAPTRMLKSVRKSCVAVGGTGSSERPVA